MVPKQKSFAEKMFALVIGIKGNERSLIFKNKRLKRPEVAARVIRSFSGIKVKSPSANNRVEFRSFKQQELLLCVYVTKLKKLKGKLFNNRTGGNVFEAILATPLIAYRTSFIQATETRISTPRMSMGKKNASINTRRDF